MPREFPEEALEAIAADMDLTARDWFGDGSKGSRIAIARKWHRKSAVIREAIDAYREATNATPLTRRAKFAGMIEDLTEKMDFRKAAAGDR